MGASFYFLIACVAVLIVVTILRMIRVHKATGTFADEKVSKLLYMITFLSASAYAMYREQKYMAMGLIFISLLMSGNLNNNRRN